MVTVADIVAKDSATFTYEGTDGTSPLESDQSISVELSLWEAAEKLAASGGRPLPVVQDGKVIGVIRKADLVHAMQQFGAPD